MKRQMTRDPDNIGEETGVEMETREIFCHRWGSDTHILSAQA